MLSERLDGFMARANAAYYATSDPFADFTTSPEISQVFGEILGAWTVVVWQSMGSPRRFVLAEAGPGRGTLMADALRLIGRLAPGCMAALRLHLIETSPRLRAAQRAALAHASPVWHDHLDTVPEGPLILLANEFLDALPIRQFRRAPDGGLEGWQERHVETGHGRAGRGVWHASGPPPGPAGGRDIPASGVLETGEAALSWLATLCGRLRTHTGAALLLDYGPEEPGYGDTLQALSAGAACDPFVEPGTADLTAHVDFPALREAAQRGVGQGVTVHGPMPQGRFLSSLGLFARVERLARSQPPGQAADLVLAAHRLASATRMGALFKAMALCHPSLAPPPGFAVDGEGAAA